MGSGVSPVGKSKAAAPAVKKSTNTPSNPVNLTNTQARALKTQYESGFDASTKKSVDKYISADNFANGYSLSQTMNHLVNSGIDLQDPNLTPADIKARTGLSLTRSELTALQRTDKNIDAAMHPIGMDVFLQRGCHAGDIERNFGIKDYDKMTIQQLQARLVGGTFQNSAVMSTSYNVSGNPFLGSGPASGGREIVYNIKAGANTPMVWGAMNQNEVVLGKNTNWRITGVRFTGKTARPRSSMKSMPQLEIDIETF